MQTNPAGAQNAHSRKSRLARLLWGVVYTLLFRPSPWFMGAWRTWLLRCFGAKIKYARFHSSVKIWAPWKLECGTHVWVDMNVNLYNAFGIKLEDRVVISQNAFLCSATHDYTNPIYPLTGKVIVVESDTWIAADVFVAPGVTVHQGAVVGARAVVTKDVPPWSVVAGNPARVIKERELH
ncbi:MAG: putative colanic acid biosynthesis acetyltransferase [Phycisphaerae bacterium]